MLSAVENGYGRLDWADIWWETAVQFVLECDEKGSSIPVVLMWTFMDMMDCIEDINGHDRLDVK